MLLLQESSQLLSIEAESDIEMLRGADSGTTTSLNIANLRLKKALARDFI